MRHCLVAVTVVCGVLCGASAHADDAPAEIAARVTLEAPGDAGKSNWVDFHVDGGGTPSIERCERLVENELKRVYPAGVTIKPKVVRPCQARPLPSAGPPMLDAQILRVREPLPSLDLYAIGAPPTTGHIIRYTRLLSGVECDKKRDRLIAAARSDAGKEQAKSFLDEQARLNQEQIRKACDTGSPTEHKPVKRARGVRDPWLVADVARSRCEQAKRMGEILAAKRAEGGGTDAVERTCVRQ